LTEKQLIFLVKLLFICYGTNLSGVETLITIQFHL